MAQADAAPAPAPPPLRLPRLKAVRAADDDDVGGDAPADGEAGVALATDDNAERYGGGLLSKKAT